MERLEPEEPQFLHGRVLGVHHTADGTSFEVGTYSNMDPERQRELLADTMGIPTEDVVNTRDINDRRARVVVGFRKWRSSWDPKAQPTDPNLN